MKVQFVSSVRYREARKAVAMSKPPDLVAMLSRWQTVLRLLDWRIKVGYVKSLCAPSGEEVFGLCSPMVDNKSATILVRDPTTPPGGYSYEEACGQVEETVVHELLHLHFAAFGTCSPAEVAAEEQAVWSIAEALIKNKGTPQVYRIARAMMASVAKARRNRIANKGKGTRNMLSKEQAESALESLKTGNGDAALEFLAQYLVDAATGGGGEAAGDGPMSAEVPGDGEDVEDQKPDAPPGKQRGAKRSASVAVTAADKYAKVLERNAQVSTKSTVKMMLHTATVIDGLEIPSRVEAKILAAKDVDEAESILDTVRAMTAKKPKEEQHTAQGGASQRTGHQRSRSGAEPPGTGARDPNAPQLTAHQRRLRATLDQRGRDDLAGNVRARAAKK